MLSYHGTSVNKETRPWDLLGGSFPDNYMWGLLDDINKIFDELSSFKNAKAFDRPKNLKDFVGTEMTINELRRKIITDLFGDPKGPRFQTNDEKILAHGFDLKTSFRKM